MSFPTKVAVAGTIVQTKRAIGTDNITTSSSSYVDMKDMTVTITTGNNPVLIIAHIPWYPAGTNWGYVILTVDGTTKTGFAGRYTSSYYYEVGSLAWLETLAEGEHTIKVRWRSSAGMDAHQNGASRARTLMAIEFKGAI